MEKNDIATFNIDEPTQESTTVKHTDFSFAADGDSLVQNGMNFFSQLVNTLSNEQALKKLAETITEKDTQTGQTYLKLPVDSGQTVEKALMLLAGLLTKFGR